MIHESFKEDPVTSAGACPVLGADALKNHTQVRYGDENQTYFASNYARCSLRDWLNADFFQTAFSTAQQANILTTHLINKSTSDYYDAPDTDDKIFLLSFDEAQKSAYGFSFTYTRADVPRRARGTDYAKAQGLFVNTRDDTAGLSEWWTRTPNSPSSSVNCVMADGCIQRSAAATWTEIGVRPACVFAELRDEVEDDECRWCGRTHGGSFFDRITSFFHALLCRLFLA